jgi:hypothetical protein
VAIIELSAFYYYQEQTLENKKNRAPQPALGWQKKFWVYLVMMAMTKNINRSAAS